MTDEDGPDSEPVHEDVSQDAPQDTPQDVPQEEPAPQPAEGAEAWSDDHPPVDDFSDAGATGEETATVSEEAAEEEAVVQSAPPSRSMLPLFAGIGGILLIGAVIYWQFGHSSPPPMLTMQSQAPKSASSLPLSSKSALIPPANSDKVAESDITALYKAPPEPAPPSIPSPSPSAETPPPMAMPAPPAAVPAPAMPIAPPTAMPAVISQANSPTPAVNARIDTLATSMDTLQKSVEMTAQEVNKLGTMMAANQAMPPVSSQVSPALEDRLNKIEQSLLQIEHTEAAKPPPPVTASNETEAMSEVVTKPVSHHRKPVKHKPAHNVHKKTVHHAVRSPSLTPASVPAFPEPARFSSSWVLRAATPGEAWVASDAHTTELKHVQVGDSLQGIGTVRAIRQTPGGWEVEGTAGTIR